jgi:hypothetical protein
MIRWLILLLLLAPLAAAQPVGPIPYSALPSCADSGGNHLNANSTTGAITCGTSTSGGSGTVTGPGSSTVGHFATWNNTGGTSLADGGAPAASATTDTTSASNISSGTLPAGRLPALTGDVTSSSGSAATTLAAGSASNLNSGTLAAARGGAGTVNGALKGNGSGVVSQAACADLSNGATGCSTATGTQWRDNSALECCERLVESAVRLGHHAVDLDRDLHARWHQQSLQVDAWCMRLVRARWLIRPQHRLPGRAEQSRSFSQQQDQTR